MRGGWRRGGRGLWGWGEGEPYLKLQRQTTTVRSTFLRAGRRSNLISTPVSRDQVERTQSGSLPYLFYTSAASRLLTSVYAEGYDVLTQFINLDRKDQEESPTLTITEAK